jgi:hypothetical protein
MSASRQREKAGASGGRPARTAASRDRARRRVVVAAAAVVLAVVAATAFAAAVGGSPARGAPTARAAVQRYLDALALRDGAALRKAFTSGSARAEIDARLRDYGGPAARAATVQILDAEPPLPGVPRNVVLTFRGTTGTARDDRLAVREKDGRWLMVVEAAASPTPCASGAVCDATP